MRSLRSFGDNVSPEYGAVFLLPIYGANLSHKIERWVRLAILRSSISSQITTLKTYGFVGREFKLRPFSVGSILTF